MEKRLKDLKSEYSTFINQIESNLSIIKSKLGKEELEFSKSEIDVFFDMYINSPSRENLQHLFYTYTGEAFLNIMEVNGLYR